MQLLPLLEGVTVRATGTTTQRELTAQLEAASTKSNKPVNSYTTITIAVSPRDAQRVVLAQQAGRIIALLRRPDDAALYNDRLSSSDVFGSEAPPPEPKVAPTNEKTIAYIVGGGFSTGGQGVRAPSNVAPNTGSGAPNLDMLKKLLQGSSNQ
jgi:pilus assembly protein CpaB